MILLPILTEKSIADSKKGNYTFWVDRRSTKYQIRKVVHETFDVKVVKVRTINVAGESKKTVTGRKRVIKSKKKAIVTLGEKDKIDLFDAKIKKKS